MLPLTGDIARAKRGLPAFAWEPQKGAFVGLMARGAGVDSVRWIEVDPVYVFHPANAYEKNGHLHCDMMEYPSAPLFPESGRIAGRARPGRAWCIGASISPIARARVVRTPLSDLAGEFPRIDERFAGLPYRHCWHAANVRDERGAAVRFAGACGLDDPARDAAAILQRRQRRRAGVRAAQRRRRRRATAGFLRWCIARPKIAAIC